MDQIKVPNETLEPLRRTAKENPTNVAAWRALSSAILAEIRSASTKDRQGLTIEYVQSLSKIRKLDPEDKESLEHGDDSHKKPQPQTE